MAQREYAKIREDLVKKQQYHNDLAIKFTEKIASLDEREERKRHNTSFSSVINATKNDFTPEEMLAILDAARRKKQEMGAI